MEKLEDALQANEEAPQVPWSLILLAGGAGWLIVTVTALLWMYPMSGRMVGNVYYVSTGARALQHLMVFALSALGVIALVVWAVSRSRSPAATIENGPRKA